MTNRRKIIIQDILANYPEKAILVKNKYKVIALMAQKIYPELKEMNRERVADICFDIIAGNREWQQQTEGEDKKEKQRLEAKALVELGYRANQSG